LEQWRREWSCEVPDCDVVTRRVGRVGVEAAPPPRIVMKLSVRFEVDRINTRTLLKIIVALMTLVVNVLTVLQKVSL
jgi:hypothetical protein